MKIIAYSALLYGKDYLAYAIRSVAPAVHEWWFAYSPVGSHGYKSELQCPDAEAELKAIAKAECAKAGIPAYWYTEDWLHEGEQRDSIYQNCPDADVIIVVDADEVWMPSQANNAIMQAYDGQRRINRVPFVHFWRSFHWVCRDAAQPARVILPKVPRGGDEGYLDVDPVLHFGYARDPRDIWYKMSTHGHKGEWRADWWGTKFMNWMPDYGPYEDLHPTNRDFWTAEPYDEVLPEILADHPYRDMLVIGNPGYNAARTPPPMFHHAV